jgi:soluble lytic murein transglycosylase-like protein
MRHSVKTAVLMGLAGLMAAVPASGDVYKYRDANGLILLTDRPMEGMHLERRYDIETGRTRSGGGNALAAMRQRREALDPLIAAAAAEADLHADLVHAVIRAESAYRADAVSHKGAMGLMQLMPATAERFGVTDRGDPEQNLRGGTTYLRELLTMFDNDLILALAAYNAGENAVLRYGRQVPPFPETQTYVRRVLAFYEQHADERLALR